MTNHIKTEKFSLFQTTFLNYSLGLMFVFNAPSAAKGFLIFMGVFFYCGSLFAQTISKVKVKGNVRIEKASILEKISLKPGQKFSNKSVTEDVKSLFDTGFFYDIKVDLTGTVLTYEVEEKPVIGKIKYTGNLAFDEKELGEIIEIKINEILDIKKINQGIGKIKKKYEEKGYYLVKADYKVKDFDNGSKELIFEIKEGDKVKIKKVNLVGNESISDGQIKSILANRPKGLFGMSGSFDQEALVRDREVIGYIFRNEGFAQVKVSEPEVELTKDKRGLSLTYYIEEGAKYKMGEIKFSGDVDFTKEEMLEDIKSDDIEYFSQAQLLEDISVLQAKYGDEGYAYTNVVPRPEFEAGSDVVGIVFDVSKGEKITLGEINMIGNTITRDKVIRRELRVFEGELYNETEKRKSVANVRRLGFFENVEFQQKVSPKSPDVMDIDVNVEERSTGQLNLGAGYGGYQGFSLQGSVQQSNFLGRGINLGVNINYSENFQQLFNLNITDPYFRDTDWSLGFDAYQSLRRVIDYEEIKVGGSLSVGRRFGDFLSTSLRYKLENVNVYLSPAAFTDVYTPARVESTEGLSSSVTASIAYDRRNDRQFPSKGYFGRFSLEQSGLFGDLTYTKASANFRFYKPLVGSLVWRNNIEYGWVGAPGEVPFNELYRIGGPNTIRGYDFFSIAQKEYSASAASGPAYIQGIAYPDNGLIPYGGIQQFYYNLEFEWALVKEAKIKGVVFIDAGMADNAIDFSEIKSSYGFGVRWISPMGTLRFEWGFPINPDETLGEKENDFQFSIMQPF